MNIIDYIQVANLQQKLTFKNQKSNISITVKTNAKRELIRDINCDKKGSFFY